MDVKSALKWTLPGRRCRIGLLSVAVTIYCIKKYRSRLFFILICHYVVLKEIDSPNGFQKIFQQGNLKPGRGQVSRTFFLKLIYLLRIAIPTITCREVRIMIALSTALVLRSFMSIWIAGVNGSVVKTIVSRNFRGFLREVGRLASYAVPACFVNSAIEYLGREFSTQLRWRMTRHFLDLYFRQFNYYKMSNLDIRVTQPEQRLTQDLEKWAHTVSQLFSNVSKPVLDIILFSRKLSQLVGPEGPLAVIAWYAVSALAIKAVSPAFGELIAEEQELEGYYRSCHTNVVLHSEEIAFYKGADFEKQKLDNAFQEVVSHVRLVLVKRFWMGGMDSLLVKYGAVLLGYAVVGMPVFGPNKQLYLARSGGDSASITQDYVRNSSLLINLAKAIGRLVVSYKDIQALAGHTEQVFQLAEVSHDLERGCYVAHAHEHAVTGLLFSSPMSPSSNPSTAPTSQLKTLSASLLETALQQQHQIQAGGVSNNSSNDEGILLEGDEGFESRLAVFEMEQGTVRYSDNNEIAFEGVPICTPDGQLLLDGLTLRITPGMHIFILGPNGCGKSSLFRVLSGLWPLVAGRLTKPRSLHALFYLPQQPYLFSGSLREQLIYPHTLAEFKLRFGKKKQTRSTSFFDGEEFDERSQNNKASRNHSNNSPHQLNGDDDDLDLSEGDAFLFKLLNDVRLSYLTSRWGEGLDSVAIWGEILSGGEKQRLAMARLLYNKPIYAVLDEATSAVSVDVEGLLYQLCLDAGITVVSISHRMSLLKYHNYLLRLDGRGGWRCEVLPKTLFSSSSNTTPLPYNNNNNNNNTNSDSLMSSTSNQQQLANDTDCDDDDDQNHNNGDEDNKDDQNIKKKNYSNYYNNSNGNDNNFTSQLPPPQDDSTHPLTSILPATSPYYLPPTAAEPAVALRVAPSPSSGMRKQFSFTQTNDLYNQNISDSLYKPLSLLPNPTSATLFFPYGHMNTTTSSSNTITANVTAINVGPSTIPHPPGAITANSSSAMSSARRLTTSASSSGVSPSAPGPAPAAFHRRTNSNLALNMMNAAAANHHHHSLANVSSRSRMLASTSGHHQIMHHNNLGSLNSSGYPMSGMGGTTMTSPFSGLTTNDDHATLHHDATITSDSSPPTIPAPTRPPRRVDSLTSFMLLADISKPIEAIAQEITIAPTVSSAAANCYLSDRKYNQPSSSSSTNYNP